MKAVVFLVFVYFLVLISLFVKNEYTEEGILFHKPTSSPHTSADQRPYTGANVTAGETTIVTQDFENTSTTYRVAAIDKGNTFKQTPEYSKSVSNGLEYQEIPPPFANNETRTTSASFTNAVGLAGIKRAKGEGASNLGLELDSRQGNLSVQCQGRLGNRLFQFAALMGMAERHHMNPVYSNRLARLSRYFETKKRLNIPAENFSVYLTEVTNMGGSDDNILNMKETRVNVRLKGFFQSTDYFSNVEDILRKEIVFRPEIIKIAEGKIEKYNPGLWESNATKVGIHIRRGDFLKKRREGRTIAPAEYYKKAMAYMLDKYPNSVFIITGNVKEWAAKELSEAGSLFFVEDGTPEEDMYLLSACDHVIVSSGSYTWWVGWLNKGTVVYFDLYPKPGSELAAMFDAKKYYLPHWIPLH